MIAQGLGQHGIGPRIVTAGVSSRMSRTMADEPASRARSTAAVRVTTSQGPMRDRLASSMEMMATSAYTGRDQEDRTPS